MLVTATGNKCARRSHLINHLLPVVECGMPFMVDGNEIHIDLLVCGYDMRRTMSCFENEVGDSINLRGYGEPIRMSVTSAIDAPN